MAHWIIDDKGFGGTTYTCSDCECAFNDLFWDICSTSDCPECGAVMTEDDNVYVKYEKHSRASHVSEYARPPLYLCDRKACGITCSYPTCKHTTDIRHAKNFKTIGVDFWEKEGCRRDRDTALAILKEFSRDMRPGEDLFGNKTLVINRDQFEAIRKKYLDRK